jgi:hypothetical protein
MKARRVKAGFGTEIVAQNNQLWTWTILNKNLDLSNNEK